jgi:organic hydroperoxide reductase OsmC/OhrA
MSSSQSATVRAKEFHFPVGVEWIGDRRVAAHVAGKVPIEVVPPPEFRGTDPSTWSPEDFFVAAAASCLAVTFTGLAQRAGLGFECLAVDGDGVAGKRRDGHFGFTRLSLELRIEVDPDDVALARELARKAEETCLVSVSLDLPVELAIDVTPSTAVPAAAGFAGGLKA